MFDDFDGFSGFVAALTILTFNDMEAGVISYDQEKDRIEWVYMFTIMETMGIPEGLIKWCRLPYFNHASHVIVYNYIGPPIRIKSGIRQGCPLSPLLFAICSEGLSRMIMNNPYLEVIQIPDEATGFKNIQHADDFTVFISRDQDFNVLNDTMETYSQGSGSRKLLHRNA